jgi:hypothetical protein
MAHTEAFLGSPTEWLRAERARRPRSLPTRGVGATLLHLIRDQPGIHFRALGREAGLTSSGQLRHHLDRLADLGAIAEVKDGRFSRFFAGGGEEDPRDRLRQARFSRPVPNLIARLLSERPMSRTELRRRLGCADSTLGYHLNRLLQVGDIQRRIGPNGHEYALTDSGLVPPELPWRRSAGQPAAAAGQATPVPATVPNPAPAPAAPAPARPQPVPRPPMASHAMPSRASVPASASASASASAAPSASGFPGAAMVNP